MRPIFCAECSNGEESPSSMVEISRMLTSGQLVFRANLGDRSDHISHSLSIMMEAAQVTLITLMPKVTIS